jgi:hypothetical protein
MLQFILKENVLSDDVLSIPDKGRIFKGGYIAIVQVYTFQNEWSDKCTTHRFRKVAPMLKFLKSKYPANDLDFSGTCIEA